MVDVGQPAPEFALKSHEGEEFSLAGARGSWVIIHSFPAAFTGG